MGLMQPMAAPIAMIMNEDGGGDENYDDDEDEDAAGDEIGGDDEHEDPAGDDHVTVMLMRRLTVILGMRMHEYDNDEDAEGADAADDGCEGAMGNGSNCYDYER